MSRSRTRGAALIIAMLVAALAAAIAVSVATGQQRWLAGVVQRSEQVQAQSLALAGVQWARQVLFDDSSRGTIDHLGEPWAFPLPPTPLENGSIEGSIVDVQGLLNVNDLAQDNVFGTTARQRFQRLFDRTGTPRALLDSIADWIDSDDQARPDGAEDAWYGAQTVPGLAANMELTRFAEIGAVRGVPPAAVEALRSYATALPAQTPLNVNTAPAMVLATALPDLQEGAIAGLLATRSARPFASVGDFRERLPKNTAIGDERTYAVSSSYFLVTVKARQGATQAQARALLKRSNAAWPNVVWQVVE